MYGDPWTPDSVEAQRLMAETACFGFRNVSGPLGRAIRWAGAAVEDYLVAPVAEGFRRRRAYRELMALDDRILADMGVSRNDIPHMVAGSAVRGGSLADVHVLKSAAGRIPGTPAEKTERPLAA